MAPNRLLQLHDAGQSIWLDFIDREILRNGDLLRRIRDDALTGMTSNPTIFEKAMAEGSEYDEQLASASPSLTAWDLFEQVEADDVRAACDLFRPVYDATSRRDGYVSIEVSPGAAHDANASIAEAHRLWRLVDRPNVMIKIPGTDEGAKAVTRLISDGLNVNITLLFSRDAYSAIIESYLTGLEARTAVGKPIDGIASVASFFVSRVDSEVDKRLEKRISQSAGAERDRLSLLRGRAAIANAKLAYQLFRESTEGARWEFLRARGAQPQRPLWASTSTKNPAYRDVMYVESLIGPETVNSLPPATIEAFRDHGTVACTVDRDVQKARATLDQLETAGISMSDVTDKLLADGIASFQKSFDTLIAALEVKSRSLGREVATPTA